MEVTSTDDDDRRVSSAVTDDGARDVAIGASCCRTRRLTDDDPARDTSDAPECSDRDVEMRVRGAPVLALRPRASLAVERLPRLKSTMTLALPDASAAARAGAARAAAAASLDCLMRFASALAAPGDSGGAVDASGLTGALASSLVDSVHPIL
jgi:hypothetical protein